MPFILSSEASTDSFYHLLHSSMVTVLDYVVVLLEWVGVLLIAYTAIKALVRLLKHDGHVNLYLAEGFSKALEFMLGGEILRTVVVEDMSAIYHVAGIIVLRVALTVLIHWEITCEKKEELENNAH